MRLEPQFCARMVMVAGLAATGVSVFGVTPVRAQSAPAAAAQGAAAQGPVRRLSIDDAVALALEQNLDLQVSRISPQIQDLNVSQVRTGWTPTFKSTIDFNDQTQPPSSFLSGGERSIKGKQAGFDFSIGALTKYGSTYSVGWNNGRSTSNNIFTNFNPQLTSSVSLNYTQPLLRNFRIDSTRQQLLVTRKNVEISDVQLQQTIAVTVRNVKNAYYDLMYAIDNLAVQRQSLELAQQSLKDNRARVEIGTMAPIDIVQAESEVATREEAVITAEATISRAGDRLRALVFNPSQPDFWTMRLEPTETALYRPITVDVDAAVKTALEKRTDLVSSRKQLESNDINIRYFRDQIKPDVNASITYGAQALGGTQFVRGPGFPGDIIGDVQKSYPSTLKTLFAGDFPTWTLGVQVAYPIGASSAEASLARARLQNTQAQKQLQSQELQVQTQIREFARQVTTNAKRVDATRASRVLAERRLEAEEKKYQAGTSSSFFVLQAQRDLVAARNNELLAVLDHAKSAVDYETAQQAPLTSTGGITGVSTGTTIATGTTGTTGTQQQQQQ